MDDVSPPLAEIPVGGLVRVDGRPQHAGAVGGQLGETLSARGEDHAGAVLVGIGDIGGEDEPLVFCGPADQVASPDSGRLGEVGGVGEVDEGLCSCVG